MFVQTRFTTRIPFFNTNLTQTFKKTYFSQIFDVAVIGAGAAGMSAAIHGRFDGLRIGVFEKRSSRGGSFSNTPMINNLPGHPLGISGATLSESTIQQFQKLGGSFFSNTVIKKISKQSDLFVLSDQNNKSHLAKTIILATGVAYRKLGLPGENKLEGKGIYYEVDDSICNRIAEHNIPIYIYGGGNSAGQAAVFYGSFGSHVTLIHRSNSLEKSMSKYLIERMKRIGCKTIPQTVLTEIAGDQKLTSIRVQNVQSNEPTTFKTNHLFVLIGGIPTPLPHVDFGAIELDARGYIKVTGFLENKKSLETSIPDIYAAGDITSIGAGRIQLAQAQGVQAIMEAMLSLSK